MCKRNWGEEDFKKQEEKSETVWSEKKWSQRNNAFSTIDAFTLALDYNYEYIHIAAPSTVFMKIWHLKNTMPFFKQK